MLVRYWQPLRDIEAISRQIEQVFDDVTPDSSNHPTWAPAVELKDAGDNLILRVQLPGVNAKDVDVQVTKQSVSISGELHQESNAENNRLHRSEFRYGRFQRVVSLPVGIQNDQVQADYTDGILTLTLPKVAEAQNKVVKLNLGELAQSSAKVE